MCPLMQRHKDYKLLEEVQKFAKKFHESELEECVAPLLPRCVSVCVVCACVCVHVCVHELASACV